MAKTPTPSRPLEELSEIATRSTLEGNLDLAVKTNKEILSVNANNIDALNRLGFALSCLGRRDEALTTFKKVLRLDSYNTIATKNVTRLKSFKGKSNKLSPGVISTPSHPEGLFLEEPGKTATIPLVAVAEPKVLLTLNCADPVNLVPKSHQISVTDKSGSYLGKIPDDLAARLLRLIKGGNQYLGWIKGTQNSSVHVFLRETKRAKRLEAIHSFPIEDKYSYVAFTSPDLVHAEQPETRPLEEQEGSPESAAEEPEEES